LLVPASLLGSSLPVCSFDRSRLIPTLLVARSGFSADSHCSRVRCASTILNAISLSAESSSTARDRVSAESSPCSNDEVASRLIARAFFVVALSGVACCPNETVGVAILYDGGLPDAALGDMGCAQACYDGIAPTIELRKCVSGTNSQGNGIVICEIKRPKCG
jgi:hypothetical protein